MYFETGYAMDFVFFETRSLHNKYIFKSVVIYVVKFIAPENKYFLFDPFDCIKNMCFSQRIVLPCLSMAKSLNL